MKKSLGQTNCLYPLPTTLVGALVEDRPNFITMAHVGILSLESVSLGMNKVHYTNEGIRRTETFSVNIPPEGLVVETDYCGMMTGKKTDKSSLFEVFYGSLKTAPMIRECPVNMECRLIDVLDFPSHDIFIGEVVETWCDDSVLTDGVVDLEKVRPLLFDMGTKQYYGLGTPVARCWNVGKKLKQHG
ncbi:MAG: flavin reductase family protein [Desulfatibacillaceae bacterium]